MIEPFQNALVLTGPTASGKTEVALALAESIGAEIVAMDSMTLYRGMDVGTAKPTAEERGRIPHHLLDILDPWESASVAFWLENAARCCREIESRGKRTLFVGGTPLYLKALLYGLFESPPADPDLRGRLNEVAETQGRAALHERLRAIDPTTANRLHVNDVRRVIRALEVWELTGKPISSWQQEWPSADPVAAQTPLQNPQNPKIFCLDLPRPELYARIDARVTKMFAAGWIDEVIRLRNLPFPLSREARQALGYREVFDFLDGKTTLEDAIRLVQARSRQFAKRQLTWFRHLSECVFVQKELTFSRWGLTI